MRRATVSRPTRPAGSTTLAVSFVDLNGFDESVYIDVFVRDVRLIFQAVGNELLR
jgi:hypothetical protein